MKLGELQKAWVDALESDEYQQGCGCLCRVDENNNISYCCLGVAAEVAIKNGADVKIGWSNRTRIGFNFDREKNKLFDGLGDSLSLSLRKLYKIKSAIKLEIDGEKIGLIRLNDTKKWTFKQIANLIKENADLIFEEAA